MDFYDLVERAVERCGGTRAGLARALHYNANSIRQWFLGLALPDAEIEDTLAGLAGVSQAELLRPDPPESPTTEPRLIHVGARRLRKRL